MESPLSWIRWEKALLRGKTNGVKDGGRAALWLMLFVQAQETIGRSIGLLALLGQSYFILIEYLAVGMESAEQRFCVALQEKEQWS